MKVKDVTTERRNDGGPAGVWARLAFSCATAAIIVGGSLYVVSGPGSEGKDYDAGFFVLLAIALLPAITYLVGVRRPDSVLYFGLALLLVTAAGWVFVFVSDDAFRGVYTIPAFMVTLVSSIVGMARDHASEPPAR